MCVYMYIYMYTYLYIYIFMYICTCDYFYLYIYVFNTHAWLLKIHSCSYVDVCIYMYNYVFVYGFLYIYMHIYICIYLYICTRFSHVADEDVVGSAWFSTQQVKVFKCQLAPQSIIYNDLKLTFENSYTSGHAACRFGHSCVGTRWGLLCCIQIFVYTYI